MRPGAEQRDVAVVAAPAALHDLRAAAGRPVAPARVARGILLPRPGSACGSNAATAPDRCRSRTPAAISSLPSQSSRSVGSSGSVARKSAFVRPGWLEWQRAQLSAKTLPRPRSTAPSPNSASSCDLEVARRGEPARLPEVGRPRRQEEVPDVVEPVLDRPERARSRAGTGRCRTASGRSCAAPDRPRADRSGG